LYLYVVSNIWQIMDFIKGGEPNWPDSVCIDRKSKYDEFLDFQTKTIKKMKPEKIRYWVLSLFFGIKISGI